MSREIEAPALPPFALGAEANGVVHDRKSAGSCRGPDVNNPRLEDSVMDSLLRPWRSVHDGNPGFESSGAHRMGRCANRIADRVVDGEGHSPDCVAVRRVPR